MPFQACAGPGANAAVGGSSRSLATLFWHDQCTASPALTAAARTIATASAGRPGRVESAGTFEDTGLLTELRRVLPDQLAPAVKPRMEWYRCRGASFHNDAHYGGVMFGIWSVGGPPRDVVFPRIGRRLPATAGNIIIFDPFEPHAVLDAGADSFQREHYEGSEPNLFLGFEIELLPRVMAAFGIGAARNGDPTLSSRIAINPESGAWTTSDA
jgi:hypothetical protein